MTSAVPERPTHPLLIRLIESAYARWGIGFIKGMLLLSQAGLALLFATTGPLLTKLFLPALTVRHMLILGAAALTIYLTDGIFAYVAVAPRLRILKEWTRNRDPQTAGAVWQVVAEIPLASLRLVRILVVAILNIGWILLLGWLQNLPFYTVLLIAPGAVLFRLYWLALRIMLSEQLLRPVLADISLTATDPDYPVHVRIPLTQRLFATIPAIAVVAGTTVAGIVGPHTLATIAIGVGASIAVAIGIAGLMVLLLTRSVTEPLADLRVAARRVGRGDLEVRVPVTGADDLSVLAQSFNAMISGLRERDRIRAAFGTYLDPAIAEHILAVGNENLTAGEEVEITALFLDVRGFTGFSENRPAGEVVAMLNQLFDTVVPIVGAHGGYVDKFIGDGLLAVFGAPQRYPDHADRALASALEIADVLERVPGGPRVGIGLNSGPVVAGNIGGAGRFDFTVIGDTVNVAARVEAATRQTGDVILLSEMTRRLLEPATRAATEARPAVPLKGKTQSVALYTVAV